MEKRNLYETSSVTSSKKTSSEGCRGRVRDRSRTLIVFTPHGEFQKKKKNGKKRNPYLLRMSRDYFILGKLFASGLGRDSHCGNFIYNFFRKKHYGRREMVKASTASCGG